MGAYQFFDYQPPQTDMADEVLEGLTSQPKYISPKYFYDHKGSALFEQITELEEYYLTRTEMSLFDEHLPSIAEHLGDDVCVMEYGSGSSLKIRKFLEAVTPSAYVPVDISHQHLQDNAQAVHQDYVGLDVYPICADITQRFELPKPIESMEKVGFFPGSSIGNFEPSQAQRFLQNVRDAVGEGGALLIGVDRKKPVEVLEQAYNDSAGITAAFNLNVLSHINDVLDADFVPQQFAHEANYNADLGCIQMFLRSTMDQQVNVAGRVVEIARDEPIHTENSYKYHPDEFLGLAADAGFSADAEWSDARDWFTLYLLSA